MNHEFLAIWRPVVHEFRIWPPGDLFGCSTRCASLPDIDLAVAVGIVREPLTIPGQGQLLDLLVPERDLLRVLDGADAAGRNVDRPDIRARGIRRVGEELSL